MTDTPWTPGPWKVGEVIANSPSTRVDAGDMEPVAWVYEVPDAELIAAAPEMAELLVELAADLTEWAALGAQLEGGAELETQHLHEVDALMARIRGEQVSPVGG